MARFSITSINWTLLLSFAVSFQASACKTLSSQAYDPKITGGQIVSLGEKPAVLPLFSLSQDGKLTPFCSSTLVSADTIYTAAHCLFFEPDDLVLGALIGEELVLVSKAYSSVHANGQENGYDFAILQLIRQVDWPTSHVINQTNKPLQELTFRGFGCNHWLDRYLDRLPPTFQLAYQNHLVPWNAVTELDTSTQNDMSDEIQTKMPSGPSPLVCPGDSGGALFAGHFLAGVTSRSDMATSRSQSAPASYFTALYSTKSQQLIQGVKALRSQQASIETQNVSVKNLRTTLTEQEATYLSSQAKALHQQRIYINENLDKLQEVLSNIYKDYQRTQEIP